MAGANIKIGASSSDFQNQMREVTRQLKLVSSECGVATEKAKLFGNAQEKLSSIQKELTAKIQAQNQIIGIYKDRIAGINIEIEKEKNKQLDLSQKIDEVNKKKKESIETTGKDSEETKKLSDELKKLKEEYAKSEKAIENNNNKLVEATTKMNNTEKSILKNKKALEDIDKQISNLKLEKLEKGFDKVSQASGKMSDKLKPVSTAIVGTGIASTTASITFEDSMAKVMTIADETIVSYDDMKKAILDLSNQTGISANEIANNVYDAISAGQSTGDAVNFVTESTKLAKAGFAEAGQSLDLLTTIMNSYELEASEVNKVSDILINTQNVGKVTVGELSADMGKLIPTAKSTSVNLEQVATGYALMTSKGIKSAESTTYMNSMLNELSKSGTKVSDSIKNLTGKSFQELIASGKSVGDILNILDENAKANGKSLADMFGSSEAAKAAMILVTDSGNAFNKVLSEMGNVAGATDKAFNTISDTNGNKLRVSFNEVKNSAINMGDTLAPVTEMVANGLSKVTKVLSGLSSEQLKTIATIGGSIVTINLALGAFSKFTAMLRSGVKAYRDLKSFGEKALNVVKKFGASTINSAKAVGNFTTKVGKNMVNATVNGAKAVGNLALNLGKASLQFTKSAIQAGISATKFIAHKTATIASTIATNAMSAAQATLNFIMSLNPITLIIIGITALIAAIVLLWNKCEWFRNLVMTMFESLKIAWNVTIEVFKIIWKSFVDTWNLAVEGIKSIWTSICNFFKSIWDSIVNSIKAVWEGFKNIFSSIGNSITSIWNGLTNTIYSVWENVVSGIKNAWNGIIAPFQSVVNSIKGIWDGIRSMFKLPHFSITGKFSLVPPSIPKVSVDWYYKGAIFKSPTVLGGVGVGDAFNGQGSNAEAIVPLSEMYRNIKGIVDNSTDGDTVIYLTNITELDGEVISEKTTKKVIKKITKGTNNYRRGKGGLAFG
ncbi:phage tail tape measure protein [Clostridium tertium]|uniref:Phage tail tape measure protein n=1 Tax=Clostridium tertium TaxID=1559 RepID=A0A9X3XK58_9CLOT|nr:phage tail tape measure protein [Clostridium tertium]MDC4240870.1 phage tail tape measure protein [Clostridium tertium]